MADVVTSNSAPPNAFLPSALIDPDRLAACLGALASRIDLVAIQECTSTNTLLVDDAALPLGRHADGNSGSRHGDPWQTTPSPGQLANGHPRDTQAALLLVADTQTAGRGRRGRRWVSSPADSLTFSLRWRFGRGKDLSGLSLAVGLGLRQALLDLGLPGIALKWPNDLLAAAEGESGDFAKLGGILIELASGREFLTAVIGVGINLRAPKLAELAQPGLPATGLDSLAAGTTGGIEPAERHRVLAGLLTELVKVLDRFANAGFAPFQADWNAADAFAGREIVLASEGVVSDRGTCLGVDVDGALRVRTAKGEIRWLAGDVSLRLPETDAP